jgi:hypothetical protein
MDTDMNRLTNCLPPAGGATGALIEGTLRITSVMETIVLAAIGAIVGYMVKLFLDWIYLKLKKP